MTELELHNKVREIGLGHIVSVNTDTRIVKGNLYSYVPSIDNEPDEASVYIDEVDGLTEVYCSEIKSIE